MIFDSNEEFLYLSAKSMDKTVFDCSDSCFKLNFKSLLVQHYKSLASENTLIWKTNYSVSGVCWGLSLFSNEKHLYVMDYGTGIKVIDAENGTRVSNVRVPVVEHGYGILFTLEKEMIVSSKEIPIQIFKYDSNNEEWYSVRKAEHIEGDISPCGIFYEECSQLIYLVDRSGRKLTIFRKDDLSRIKTFKLESDGHNGITIDQRTGQLFLPKTNERKMSGLSIYE